MHSRMVTQLAWRTLWRRPRRTLISVGAIGFGLFFAVFFYSIQDGMYRQLINDGVRMQAGHITIEHPEYRDAPAVDLWIDGATDLATDLARRPGIDRVKLLINGQGVARSGADSIGVAIAGVQPDVEFEMSPLVDRVVSGSYLEPGDGAVLMVGRVLAERLNVAPGKKVVLTANDAEGELVERLFRVKGVFDTGVDTLDGYLVQVPVDTARSFFNLPEGGATQVGLVMGDVDRLSGAFAEIRRIIAAHKGAATAHTWQAVMPSLNNTIQIDRVSGIFFEAILVFLVLFTILNTLLMAVQERQREFAAVMAFGARPAEIQAQVFVEAMMLAAFGVALGLTSGGLLAYWLGVTGWDLRFLMTEDMSVSGLAVDPIIHPHVSLSLLLWGGGGVFVATVFMSMLPMRRAVNVNIANLLR